MVQIRPCKKSALNSHHAAAFGLSKVILTEAWSPSLCVPRAGEGCLEKEPARQKTAPTDFLQGCEPGQHQHLAGLCPPVSTQGGGAGSELRARVTAVPSHQRDQAAWGGGMWMLFSCSPASITLSGDTLEKKRRIPNNPVSSLT